MLPSPTTRDSSKSNSRAESTNTNNEAPLVSCLRGTDRMRVDCYGNDIIIREPGIEKSRKNKVP